MGGGRLGTLFFIQVTKNTVIRISLRFFQDILFQPDKKLIPWRRGYLVSSRNHLTLHLVHCLVTQQYYSGTVFCYLGQQESWFTPWPILVYSLANYSCHNNNTIQVLLLFQHYCCKPVAQLHSAQKKTMKQPKAGKCHFFRNCSWFAP